MLLSWQRTSLLCVPANKSGLSAGSRMGDGGFGGVGRVNDRLPGVFPMLPVPTNVAIFSIILDGTANILIHLWPERVVPLNL